MKVYTEKLWIYDREAYKANDPTFTVYRVAPVDDPTALCVQRGSFKWNTTLAGTYTGGIFTYTNEKEEIDISVEVGTPERQLKLNKKASSEADAQAQLEAAIANANHGATTVSFTMMGYPAGAATQCFTLSGYGSMDGKYFIDSITHTVGGGYTMDMELSLVEAMTAANQQLYEMSDDLCLHVLVGVLNGATGQFSCINAGQRDPLLMRSQDRYNWVKTLSYAPLGQSENVVYQVLDLELRQGDRMLFHTKGLDDIQGTDGKHFSDDQLRLTLNENRSREADLEQQLQLVHDAGGVYAAKTNDVNGYVLLALEYRRQDRAQAHCVITPDATGSAQLTAFLRGQLETNQIHGRQMANVLVLADELFNLCCHQTDADSRMMAECAIPPEEDLVIFRLKGDFGGQNPLEHPKGEAAEHAIAFLERQCEHILFERVGTADTVTAVRRLETQDAQTAEREQGV